MWSIPGIRGCVRGRHTRPGAARIGPCHHANTLAREPNWGRDCVPMHPTMGGYIGTGRMEGWVSYDGEENRTVNLKTQAQTLFHGIQQRLGVEKNDANPTAQTTETSKASGKRTPIPHEQAASEPPPALRPRNPIIPASEKQLWQSSPLYKDWRYGVVEQLARGGSVDKSNMAGFLLEGARPLTPTDALQLASQLVYARPATRIGVPTDAEATAVGRVLFSREPQNERCGPNIVVGEFSDRFDVIDARLIDNPPDDNRDYFTFTIKQVSKDQPHVLSNAVSSAVPKDPVGKTLCFMSEYDGWMAGTVKGTTPNGYLVEVDVPKHPGKTAVWEIGDDRVPVFMKMADRKDFAGLNKDAE